MKEELIALITVSIHATLWIVRKDSQHDAQIIRLWSHIRSIEGYLEPKGYRRRNDPSIEDLLDSKDTDKSAPPAQTPE